MAKNLWKNFKIFLFSIDVSTLIKDEEMIVCEEKKKERVPAKNQKDKSQSSKQILSSYASNSRKN